LGKACWGVATTLTASERPQRQVEFIIDAVSHLASPISAVFNNVFDTAFPAIGRLCPIFKGADEHDLGNYRGITVGTVLSKCMLQCWRGASVAGLKIMGSGQQGKLASDVTIARQTTSSS